MKRKNIDGGYYAIKGFIYQFDKTLIDILDNPSKEIFIENLQDIEYEDFFIQVKHKEASNFSPSSIKKPVKQLLDLFLENKSRKFNLYCYFKDKFPQKIITTTIDELNTILGEDEALYDTNIKKAFLNSFILTFAPNFESQFSELLLKMKSFWSSETENQLLIKHALIRNQLLDIAIKKKQEDRKISLTEINKHISSTENLFFSVSYSKYLKNKDYVSFVKDTFFPNGFNKDSCRRLFFIMPRKGFHYPI